MKRDQNVFRLGPLAAIMATSISMEEIIMSFPRVYVKSVPRWNSWRTIMRREEMRTTIAPRLTILMSMSRFRRLTWIFQSGRIGSTTMRISMKTFCSRQLLLILKVRWNDLQMLREQMPRWICPSTSQVGAMRGESTHPKEYIASSRLTKLRLQRVCSDT